MPRIRCHTNIDCCKRLEWPTELPEVPRVGDLIRSPSSTKDKHIELQVVRVTWVFQECWDSPGKMWIAEVELHMVPSRYASLAEFEKWVERR